jgi:glycosyltransferase involved in cell wall biosynthesis
MAYRTPLALEAAGVLESLHLDVWLRPGRKATLARLVDHRAENRVISNIAPEKIHAHPEIFLLGRLRRRLVLAGRDTTSVDALLMRRFRSIARRCKSPAVFGMHSCSLELFAGRACRVLEQLSPPLSTERAVTEEELRRFKGWAPAGVARPSRWDERTTEEWELADIVWVPSAHLIPLCAQWGADPTRFRVVPYPIPRLTQTTVERPTLSSRLRVVFAGTLMLAKGVQYIYEALRNWNACPIDMHFFGPVQLTQLGVSKLTQVGTVHGPVSRAALMDEFARSDLLLFPSLSEGSALVTAEAAGMGLPVISTQESGPPDSAVLVEAKRPDMIRGALQRFLDDPESLVRASAAGLAEARRRTTAAFDADIALLARNALQDVSENARRP